METKINIYDNIITAIDSVVDNLINLANDKEYIKNYKAIVINLHNAFELIFKFKIQNRNEFMLFSMGNNGFDKLINKYKKIHQEGFSSILEYSDKYKDEEFLPHTISFNNAYEILAFLYGEKDFDARFLSALKMLESKRNGLTHYEATVYNIDIVIFKDLLEKAILLYNNEIELIEMKSFNYLLQEQKAHKYEYPITSYDKYSKLSKICESIIKTEILNDEICKIIIGAIVDNRSSELMEVQLDEREKITNIIYNSKRGDILKIREVKESIIKNEIDSKLAYIIAADMLEEKEIEADEYGTAYLSTITLSYFACSIIKKSLGNKGDLYKTLYISSNHTLEWDMGYKSTSEYDYE